MPRRSRRTISDDIHCINTSSCCAIDFSSKNVFIRLSILLLCFWPIAAIMDDANSNFLSILGLPRKNHCAIFYNNALFILKGQTIESSSLAITFTNDSFFASSTQFPSIQWIKNNNTLSSASICTVTSYGHAIIFHPNTLFQNNDTIDLNTMNWTLTSSSSSSPIEITTVAATIMKDDTILVLGHNNSALSTWILDASDDQLQWTWTELTSPSSFFLLTNENRTLISASMATTTSYILYFGVNQPTSTTTSTDNIYNVSVYCFDITSLTWMGSLLNFTSATNHIQSVMINNNNTNSSSSSSNTANNDTLLIIPDWIDTTIIHATSSDNINVTNTDAEKNQQIQQQLPNSQHGFGVLNIDASPPSSSSSLPLIDLTWQPSNNNMDSIHGGSATLVGNNVIFYGGQNVTNTNSTNFQLRFWNISDRSFLPTPAWLAPFFPSSSSPSPNPTLSTSSNAANSNDASNGNNKVIIILATLLGLFGVAFLWILGLLLWRRKKQQQHGNDGTTTRELEQGASRTTTHQHDTPRIDHHDNAATWAEQLHRSFSTILQRLRASSSPTRKKPTTALTGLAISAPLEAAQPTMDHQQQHQIDQGMQQQKQQGTDNAQPTATAPVPPPPPSMSNSAPQSTRNSWQEGSLKASRFVEHF